MKLNRTGSPLKRKDRLELNENWDIIEGEFKDVVETVSNEAFDKVIDGSKLDWSQMVDTVSQLPSNTEEGDTRGVKSDNKIYRYNGTSWVAIAEINLNPISEVDTRLNNKIDNELNSVRQDLAQSEESLENITYNARWFGINPESPNNTQAFNDMVAQIPEGSRVLFPKGRYRGNFIPLKSLDVDFQGSTLIPVLDNIPVFRFEGVEMAPVSVVGNPVYGDTSFIVSDSTNLQVDDIGYLVDESLRPTDNRPNQNTEVAKIKDIVGNEIFVYDKIRSNQNTGNVRFVKIIPLKNPSFKNVEFEINDTHYSTVSGFLRCEGTSIENVRTTNSTGVAVEHTLCYDWSVDNIKVEKARESESGKGYGVTAYKSRVGNVGRIYGNSMRHVYDMDSCYDVEIDRIIDEDGKSAPVVLSHNGYGGKIKVRSVTTTFESLGYAIFMSDQGLKEPDKQCFRDIIIEEINIKLTNHESGSLFNGVRIVNHYAGVEIKNINIDIDSDTENVPINTTAVYLRGNQMGNIVVDNIKVNKIETNVILERKNSTYQKSHNTIINNIDSELVRNAVWLKGIKKATIDNINVERVGGASRGLFRFEPLEGVNCDEIVVGESIHIPDRAITDNDIVLISQATIPPTNGFKGKFPNLTALSSASLSMSNNYTIAASVFMKSQGYLQLLVPLSTPNVTLNHETPIEAPMWEGQELIVVINGPNYQGSRGDVVIYRTSSTVYTDGTNDIVLEKGKTYRLIGHNRKWVVS